MASTSVHPLHNVKFIFRILCFSVKVGRRTEVATNTNAALFPNISTLAKYKFGHTRLYLTPRNFLAGYRRLHELRMVSKHFEEVIVYNLKHLWRAGFDEYEKETLAAVSLSYNHATRYFRDANLRNREHANDDDDDFYNHGGRPKDVVDADYRKQLSNSVPFPYSFEDDTEEFADMIRMEQLRSVYHGEPNPPYQLPKVDRGITLSYSRVLDQYFVHPLHYLAMDLVTLVASDMETPLSLAENEKHPHRFVLLDFLVLHLGVDIEYYVLAIIMTFATSASDIRKNYCPPGAEIILSEFERELPPPQVDEAEVLLRKSRLMKLVLYVVKNYGCRLNRFPLGSISLPLDVTRHTNLRCILSGHVLFKTLLEKDGTFLLETMLEMFPEQNLADEAEEDVTTPVIDLRCRLFNIADYMKREYVPTNIFCCKTLLHLAVRSYEKVKLLVEHDMKWTAIRTKKRKAKKILPSEAATSSSSLSAEESIEHDDDTSDESLLLFSEVSGTFVSNIPLMDCISQICEEEEPESAQSMMLTIRYLASTMQKFPKQLEKLFRISKFSETIFEIYPLGLTEKDSPWEQIAKYGHEKYWSMHPDRRGRQFKVSATRTKFSLELNNSNHAFANKAPPLPVRRVLKLITGIRYWSKLDQLETDFYNGKLFEPQRGWYEKHIFGVKLGEEFPSAARERLAQVFQILLRDEKTRIINAWKFEHEMVDYGFISSPNAKKKMSKARFYLDRCLLSFAALRLEFDRCVGFARSGFSTDLQKRGLMIVPTSANSCAISKEHFEQEKIRASDKNFVRSVLKPPRPTMPSLQKEKQLQEFDKALWDERLKKMQQIRRRPNSGMAAPARKSNADVEIRTKKSPSPLPTVSSMNASSKIVARSTPSNSNIRGASSSIMTSKGQVSNSLPALSILGFGVKK